MFCCDRSSTSNAEREEKHQNADVRLFQGHCGIVKDAIDVLLSFKLVQGGSRDVTISPQLIVVIYPREVDRNSRIIHPCDRHLVVDCK